MYPILFEFGPVRIFTYGFFLALGFVTAIFLAGREARRVGLPAGRFYDLCFYIILAALVGSRLLYILTELSYFLEHPLQIFVLFERPCIPVNFMKPCCFFRFSGRSTGCGLANALTANWR